jgi:hypothetical protein
VRNESNFTMYVNGLPVSSGNDASILPDTSAPLHVGESDSIYFNGTLDEIKIEKYVHTQDEILANAYPEIRLERIGLLSKIFRITVLVENKQANWYLPPPNISGLANEIVSINLSNMIGMFNPDSVSVYDESNRSLNYNSGGGNVSFIADISAGASKWFIIYAQSGGFFPTRSGAISGSDNISQAVFPPEEVEVASYAKMQMLENSNYTKVRENIGLSRFHLRIIDTLSGNYALDFGDDIPRRGDVIAFQKYVLVQNRTAGINEGVLSVQAW